MAKVVLAETIGFELEVENIAKQRLVDMPKGFKVSGDASVESDTLMIKGIPVKLHTESDALKFSSGILGSEIISSIIDTNNNYLSTLKKLCNTLVELGETEQSKRAGIHIHVSFINNLRILKSALELGAYLEDVFFLLGGMGYEFRGIENDSTYCRPITGFGPPIVEDGDDRLFPCFVLEDVLAASTMNQFVTRLGDLGRLHGNRYIPIRYVWLNLYNIVGSMCTLEFRNWNKTLDPMAIYMAIEVCKAFAQHAISRAYAKSEALPVNSIYDRRSKGEIIETFLSFAGQVGLSDHVIAIALDLMNKSPMSGLELPLQYTHTHLRFHRLGRKDPRHWVESGYRPDIELCWDEVRTPDFLDIHNLRNLNSAELERNTAHEQPRLGGRPSYRTSVSLPPGFLHTRPLSDPVLDVPDWILNVSPIRNLEEL